MGQIALAANFAGGNAVSERNDKEEQNNQRHNALNKRRRQDRVFYRIAQDTVFRHHHQRYCRDKQQRDDAGDAQAVALFLTQCLQLFITAAFPCTQTRLDDLIGDQAAHNRQHNH
ncbi:hypothetical protein D3C71_1497940 [compost metagenome]